MITPSIFCSMGYSPDRTQARGKDIAGKGVIVKKPSFPPTPPPLARPFFAPTIVPQPRIPPSRWFLDPPDDPKHDGPKQDGTDPKHDEPKQDGTDDPKHHDGPKHDGTDDPKPKKALLMNDPDFMKWYHVAVGRLDRLERFSPLRPRSRALTRSRSRRRRR